MMGGNKNYNKSIAEKRMDFELNQSTAHANANAASGFDKELRDA